MTTGQRVSVTLSEDLTDFTIFNDENEGDSKAYRVVDDDGHELIFVLTSILIHPLTRRVEIGVVERIKPENKTIWTKWSTDIFEANKLSITDNQYCLASNGSLASESNALDENGNLNTGYTTLYTWYKTNIGDFYNLGASNGLFKTALDSIQGYVNSYYNIV